MSSNEPRIPKILNLLLTRASEKKEGVPTAATDERIIQALESAELSRNRERRSMAALMTAMPIRRDLDGGAS